MHYPESHAEIQHAKQGRHWSRCLKTPPRSLILSTLTVPFWKIGSYPTTALLKGFEMKKAIASLTSIVFLLVVSPEAGTAGQVNSGSTADKSNRSLTCQTRTGLPTSFGERLSVVFRWKCSEPHGAYLRIRRDNKWLPDDTLVERRLYGLRANVWHSKTLSAPCRGNKTYFGQILFFSGPKPQGPRSKAC